MSYNYNFYLYFTVTVTYVSGKTPWYALSFKSTYIEELPGFRCPEKG